MKKSKKNFDELLTQLKPWASNRRFDDRGLPPLTEAQEKLIADHMGFVEAGAMMRWRRSGRKYDLDELKQQARMALVHAARRFKPESGLSFKTLCFSCTEGYMGRWIRAQMMGDGFYRDGRTKRKQQMVKGAQVVAWPKVADEDSSGERDVELADDFIDPTDQILLAERRAKVLSMALNARQRVIMEALLEGRTLASIAKDLGVSAARVHQLLAPVIERMKLAAK